MAVFLQLARVLKPGGQVMLSMSAKGQWDWIGVAAKALGCFTVRRDFQDEHNREFTLERTDAAPATTVALWTFRGSGQRPQGLEEKLALRAQRHQLGQTLFRVLLDPTLKLPDGLRSPHKAGRSASHIDLVLEHRSGVRRLKVSENGQMTVNRDDAVAMFLAQELPGDLRRALRGLG